MRRDSKEGQFHSDQRGFSLVEVIIAMIVLAIIAAPICHSFLTAARTNAKARKQACANAVAENVMEGINAYSYGDIALQFADGVSADAFLISTNCDRKGIVSGMVEVDGNQVPGSTVVYQIGGIDEDVYEFDVKVTVDASAYEGDAEHSGINDNELVQITSYDSSKDCLFVQSAEDEILAYQTLAGRTGGYAASAQDLKGKVKRTMTIVLSKIHDDAAGDYVKISNSVVYEYVGTEGWLTGADAVYEAPVWVRTYNGEDLLRSAYICYLPNYASTMSSAQMDQIVIDNQNNLAVDFYLLKQEGAVQDSLLESSENGYVPTIEIREGATGGVCAVSLHTNYAYNLATGNEITAGGAQYRYRYQNAEGVLIEKSAAEAQALIHPQGAMETTSAKKLYHVTVEVYESGAYGHFGEGDPAVLKKITELTSY